MKAAFYYHIPFSYGPHKEILLPGHFGVFIDELAKHFDVLTILFHEASDHEKKFNDYAVCAPNISLINLGIAKPAWYRAFFHKQTIGNHLTRLKDHQTIIIRMPCALAPFIHKYVSGTQTLWFMIVGDYKEVSKHTKVESLRSFAIKYYVLLIHWLFMRRIEGYNLIVNSDLLVKKYHGLSAQLHKINTTTLTGNDFFFRDDTCTNEVINLLFTGRLDLAKGLIELIEATYLLKKKNYNIKLNIVGWELGHKNDIEQTLRSCVKQFEIENHVIFHGKLNIGNQLNNAYRSADIYVIPSYHEGFPRTIWEALANSLPVITTAVGGIPAILTNEVNALFVSPKKSDEIVSAVEKLINNSALRQSLILNGQKIAQANTLEIQTDKLADIIKSS